MDFSRPNTLQNFVDELKLKKEVFIEEVGDNMYDIQSNSNYSSDIQAKRKGVKGRFTKFSTKTFSARSCQVCSTTFDNPWDAISCAQGHCSRAYDVGQPCPFNCGAHLDTNMDRHVQIHLLGYSIYVCTGCGITNRRVSEMVSHCANCNKQKSATFATYLAMLDVEFLFFIGAPLFSVNSVAAFMATKPISSSLRRDEETNEFIVVVPLAASKLKRALATEEVNSYKRVRCCIEPQIAEDSRAESVDQPMHQLLEVSILTTIDSAEDDVEQVNRSVVDLYLNSTFSFVQLDLDSSMNQESDQDPFENLLNSSLNFLGIRSTEEVDDSSSDVHTDDSDEESVESAASIEEAFPIIDDINADISSVSGLVDASDDNVSRVDASLDDVSSVSASPTDIGMKGLSVVSNMPDLAYESDDDASYANDSAVSESLETKVVPETGWKFHLQTCNADLLLGKPRTRFFAHDVNIPVPFTYPSCEADFDDL